MVHGSLLVNLADSCAAAGAVALSCGGSLLEVLVGVGIAGATFRVASPRDGIHTLHIRLGKQKYIAATKIEVNTVYERE